MTKSKLKTVFRKAPFERVVREIAQVEDVRFSKDALVYIQQITENHLGHVYNGSNRVAQNAGRKTVMAKDIELVASLCHKA
jgi:histone H3/H4